VDFGELDVVVITEDFAREPRLTEIPFVAVDPEHAVGPAALHLDRVEAGVAADVEHAFAAEVPGQLRREAAELGAGIIAEEMVGRGPRAAEIDVVKPGAERDDARFEIGTRHGAKAALDE